MRLINNSFRKIGFGCCGIRRFRDFEFRQIDLRVMKTNDELRRIKAAKEDPLLGKRRIDSVLSSPSKDSCRLFIASFTRSILKQL